MKKIVSYIRVSTHRQGESGLGLEAQKVAVTEYVDLIDANLVAEFVEIESGRKSDKDRPQLAAALATCKQQKAILIVAKLDRLARNVHFISGLMESKVKFLALDMPEANELTLHLMAAFAEHESKRISERTKAALAIAKSRGKKLGVSGKINIRSNIEQRREKSMKFARSLAGIFQGFKLREISQRKMVEELNELQIRTINGRSWSLIQVQRVIGLLNSLECSSRPSHSLK
jgi:DNA invertase Pin-like site-specific DNA recombinase